MVQRIGGYRRKTRYKLRKQLRNKGKLSISRYLQQLNIGEKVILTIEPSIQKGMYDPAFMGKIGIVKAKKGRCYEIFIKDGGKSKVLIAHPIHIKRLPK